METAKKTIVTILVTGKYVMLALPHAVEIRNGVHLLESIIRGMHVIHYPGKLVIRSNVSSNRYRVKKRVLNYTFVCNHTVLTS